MPNDWNALPPAEGPITVGIDGGYLRNWTKQKTNFEVIVGKSVPTERPAKCFAMVQIYDDKPKRRLFDVLSPQGMQMNQDVVFMSDARKAVRELQLYPNPRATHMLDWFHITMRVSVLGQFLKGLRHAKLEEDAAPLTVTGLVDEMECALARTKWNLWHGRPAREGLVISTAFVESLVNSLLGKRFTKEPQMQWMHRGAHLLLQTRTLVVNGELEATFRQWYPAMRTNGAQPVLLSEAA